MNQADRDHEKWQEMNSKHQYRELIKAKENGDLYHISNNGDVIVEKNDETR